MDVTGRGEVSVLEEEFPCSFQQVERLRWMTREPGATFLSGLLVETAAPLDGARLRHALTRVVARHPALRSSLAPGWHDHEQASCQVRSGLDALPLEIEPEPVGLPELIARSFGPFDVCQPPLWRAVCCRAASGGSYLALAIDHLFFDGSSAEIILNDLRAAYDVPSQPLSAPEATYAEFAQWQRGGYVTDEIADDMEYWDQILSAATLERPVPVKGFSAALAQASREDQVAETLLLGESPWEKVLDCCSRLQCSPFHLITTVLVKSLSELSGVCDITLLCPVAARPPGFEDVVGWFANLMPVRVSWDPAIADADLVSLIRDQALDALDHCLVPWDLLRDHFGFDLSLPEKSGLVQINVRHHGVPDDDPGGGGWRLLNVSNTMGQSGLDIGLAMAAGGLKLTCSYPRAGYPQAVIAELLEQIHSGVMRLSDTF